MVDIYEQFRDFKSFEVMFEKENGEPQKLFCNVKNIDNSIFVVESDNKVNKNIHAKVGDELKLYIYTDNGIYSAESKVLGVTKHDKLTEYVIDYPANSKHSQRREYFRAGLCVDFKMDIKLPEGSGSNKHLDATTKNICGKGMSYIADKPFIEYESIKIDLLFAEKTIKTSTKLVYSKQIIIANKPKYVHAFTFTDISQREIDFIVKKCFLHQLEMRKQGKD
jgi:c-di-GMP-binding flagellar brake protein YcgR